MSETPSRRNRIFHKKTDAEFVEYLRHARRRRAIGAAILFALGLWAIFLLVRYSADMYRNYRDTANMGIGMATPPEQTAKKVAENLSYILGVRVGHATASAIWTAVMSLGIAVQLLVRPRTERLLIEYFDQLHRRTEDAVPTA